MQKKVGHCLSIRQYFKEDFLGYTETAFIQEWFGIGFKEI